MTEAEAKEAILERWEDEWEALHPADPDDPDHVPYTFENESFAGVAAYASVNVNTSTSAQTTQGGPGTKKVERRGSIMVQLFTATDVGTGLIDLLVEDVRAVFETRAIVYAGGAVNCYAARAEPVPTDGAWLMKTVVIPYRIVDTR